MDNNYQNYNFYNAFWQQPQMQFPQYQFGQQQMHTLPMRQVDSWRSYTNDTTNLQSQLQPSWNVMAPSFTPTQQPLSNQIGNSEASSAKRGKRNRNKKRAKGVQNGLLQTDSQVASRPVQHNEWQLSQDAFEYSTTFAQRYPMRSRRGLSTQAAPGPEDAADQPLPSIEPDEDYRGKRSVKRQPSLPKRERTATKSPEAPMVASQYMTQASKPPVRILKPQKLLVILDLNGTLLYRSSSANAAGLRKVHLRPGVTAFLDYLFEHHTVMVYTSAQQKSATHMLDSFMHPLQRKKLAAIWARDRLDLNKEQYRNKVQVYKKLDKIWKDETIQKTAPNGTKWDQSNTVLVDDTMLKAKAQPYNLLQVSEYTVRAKPDGCKKTQQRRTKNQLDIMKQLQLKLEELALHKDISTVIRLWQNGTVKPPTVPGQEVIIDETIDQGADKEEVELSKHLPTPDTQQDQSSDDFEPQSASEDDADAGAPLSPVSEIDEDAFDFVKEKSARP